MTRFAQILILVLGMALAFWLVGVALGEPLEIEPIEPCPFEDYLEELEGRIKENERGVGSAWRAIEGLQSVVLCPQPDVAPPELGGPWVPLKSRPPIPEPMPDGWQPPYKSWWERQLHPTTLQFIAFSCCVFVLGLVVQSLRGYLLHWNQKEPKDEKSAYDPSGRDFMP